MRMNVRIGDVLRLNIPDSDVLHNREVIVTDIIRSVFDRRQAGHSGARKIRKYVIREQVFRGARNQRANSASGQGKPAIFMR